MQFLTGLQGKQVFEVKFNCPTGSEKAEDGRKNQYLLAIAQHTDPIIHH